MDVEGGANPSSSTTIAPENSNDVLACVAHIVRTLIKIIVGVPAFVSEIVSAYFNVGEGYYNDEMKEKGILWRIFFSPLRRKNAFIISCIAVSIDPLFFYIPVIDEKNKCLGIDKRLKTAALCLRALPDAAFALQTINHVFRILKKELDDEDFDYGTVLLILIFSFIGILIGGFLILPIPQLAIVVFFFKSGSSGHSGQRVTTVNVFLVMHYLARVFFIYRYSKHLKNKTRTGVQAALYFFFYVLSSHVLGGFWYFFSIQREISCWHQSCRNAISCGATDYCSDSTSRNITFLDELCPSNPPNATVFNFGIFLDAIQYGITRSMHFPTKFFYCIWWGIRNLSNFGTNMQTSSYVWENCFAIIVSLIGLLLFLYLLGNLQIYMQQALTRALTKEELGEMIFEKEKEKQKCKEMLRKQEPGKKIDGEVDVNYIFSIHNKFWRAIKGHSIGWEMPKEVKELQHMNDCALGTICEYLKPKVFEENAKVVEVGEPLNAMLYIIAGSMQADLPITDAGEAAPSTSFDTLEKGMFVGEQLLYWAMKTKAFDDQPTSFKTIRCTKKVEAFALTVDDLKTLALSGDIFPMKFKVRLLKIATEPKIREKLEVIFLWMTINGVYDDVALDIMRGISQHKLEENIDAEVDVNYIFSVLDEYGKSIMGCHFCKETLKKVNELQNMSDYALKTICKYLKPKMFEEKAMVVEGGQPLNSMLIIISGSMQAVPTWDAYPSTSFETLEKGMFVGEQLLDWAVKTKNFDDQPISLKTVRCSEKVEAFALTVDDLKTLVHSFDISPLKSKGRMPTYQGCLFLL